MVIGAGQVIGGGQVTVNIFKNYDIDLRGIFLYI
jgi:hypothetical protein